MLLAKSLLGRATSVDYRSIHAIFSTTSSCVFRWKFGIHQWLLGGSKCVLSDMLLAKIFTMSMLQLSTILVNLIIEACSRLLIPRLQMALVLSPQALHKQQTSCLNREVLTLRGRIYPPRLIPVH